MVSANDANEMGRGLGEWLDRAAVVINTKRAEGWKPMEILGLLTHDIAEFRRDGFDVQATLKRAVHPKVYRY